MTAHEGSRFKKTDLSPRQLKAFDKMYLDRTYSIADIADRFGLSPVTVNIFARERNLALRPISYKPPGTTART